MIYDFYSCKYIRERKITSSELALKAYKILVC
jgi:hypothetical protein